MAIESNTQIVQDQMLTGRSLIENNQRFKASGKNAGGATQGDANGGAVAAGGGAVAAGGGGSWYEALVSAWGTAMDSQAHYIEALSNQLESTTVSSNNANAAFAQERSAIAKMPAGQAKDIANAELDQKEAEFKASPGGSDEPSVLITLTGASQKMGFLSSSAATSVNSVGEAQDKLARKG
jgi:hypothetical protein